MAVAVGNVAVAGAVASASSCTSSSVSRRGLGLKASPPSWESFVKVSLSRGVSSPSSSGRRLSLRASGRPNFRRAVASKNGAAKELFTEDEVSDSSQATSNGLQSLHLPKDSSSAADASNLLLEFEQLLEEKGQEVEKLNQGTTIFLVGMMASGKSTVGRLVAEALDYNFFDSDEVIESYVGGLPVKDIFRQKSEVGFRELETRALRELSATTSLVVATGGGAVVRRENWAYLQDGITVFLDVPVEDLAKRVTAVGTESRPLLGGDCGAFDQAYSRLSKLMDERGPHYALANCRLSFKDLATDLQLEAVAELTPTAVAVQVLEEIRRLYQWRKYMQAPVGY